MKVFLDGPRVDSKWKDKLIPLLKCDYCNPTGEGWNPEDEIEKKLECPIHLYVITPKMRGFHLIAQLMESASWVNSYVRGTKYVVCCVLFDDNGSSFNRQQGRSLNLIKDIFKQYDNCIVCNSLEETANLLNTLNN